MLYNVNKMPETSRQPAEGYAVLRKTDEPHYVEFFRDRLEKWHAFKPETIVLLDSATVPLGMGMKEAWKTAYPDEPQPRFLRMDPRPFGGLTEVRFIAGAVRHARDEDDLVNRYGADRGKYFWSLREKFAGLGGKRTLVFDEYSTKFDYDGPAQFVADGERQFPVTRSGKTETELGPSIQSVMLFLKEMDVADVWCDVGMPEMPGSTEERTDTYYDHIYRGEAPEARGIVGAIRNRITGLLGRISWEERYVKPVEKRSVALPKDAEKRRNALAFVDDMQEAGRRAATQVLERGKREGAQAA